MQTLKKGSKGEEVRALEFMLNMGKADDRFNSATRVRVKKYQEANGLPVDGIVGAKTWGALARDAPTCRKGDEGPYVKALQALMYAPITGVVDDATVAKVKTYQATVFLSADGIAGPQTWSALLGVTAPAIPATPTSGKRPKDFKQYDSRWKKKMYSNHGDKGQTMSNSGCGPTACADIVATLSNPAVTPYTLAKLYMTNGYRTNNSGTAWGAFKFTFNKYPGFRRFVQTSSHTTAAAALNEGALVVASMGPGYWTKGGHFICLWRCDDTYMYACDPASATRKKQKIAAFRKQNKQYFIFWPKEVA